MPSTESKYRNSDIKLGFLVLLRIHLPMFGNWMVCIVLLYVNTWVIGVQQLPLYRPLVVSSRLLVCLSVTWVQSNN